MTNLAVLAKTREQAKTYYCTIKAVYDDSTRVLCVHLMR